MTEPKFPARSPDQAALARSAGKQSIAPAFEERRILAVAGRTRRVGKWLVPKLLVVRAFFGDVNVDLRHTTIPEKFTLDVRAYGSSVTLIVPPGVSVAFDIFAFMGNAINQAHELPEADGGTPHIHVVGSAYLGEVRVLVRER